MTQGEMEDGYVAANGGTKADVHEKFQAWENALKTELAAKRAVQIDGIGTFRPKELTGKDRVTKLGGKEYTTPIYAMVKKPEVVTTTEFQAKMVAAGKMTDEEFSKVNAYYKSAVISTLRKGGALQEDGLGTYKVGRHQRHTSCNKKGVCTDVAGYKDVKFNDSPSVHTTLKVDPTLNAKLN